MIRRQYRTRSQTRKMVEESDARIERLEKAHRPSRANGGDDGIIKNIDERKRAGIKLEPIK